MSLLPVPARPPTTHLATISQSSTGSRKKAPSYGGASPAGVIIAPSLPHCAMSQPLAKDQVPERRYPPSTGIAVPVGDNKGKGNGSASPSHNSRCAWIGQCASE